MKSRALILITMTLFAALAITASMDAQEQKIEKPQQYTFTDLGTLGGPTSTANGINNKGWVTGVSDLPGGTTFHGFLWQKGAMTPLRTLGGNNGYATGVNNRGQVVGLTESTRDSSCTAPQVFDWEA